MRLHWLVITLVTLTIAIIYTGINLYHWNLGALQYDSANLWQSSSFKFVLVAVLTLLFCILLMLRWLHRRKSEKRRL